MNQICGKKCYRQELYLFILFSVFTYATIFTGVLYFFILIPMALHYRLKYLFNTYFRVGFLPLDFLSFCLSHNSLVLFIFWKMVLLDIESLVETAMFHQYMENVILISSLFHCYWWKFNVNLFKDFIHNESFLSCGFQDFLLTSAFNCLTLICLDIDFYECILFKLAKFLGCVD